MTIVMVTGTGTAVGKTWWSVSMIDELRRLGLAATARKPAQSFSPDELGRTDAELLARATGDDPTAVCPAHRWYEVPMAPPMAAEVLHRPPFTIADLVAETNAAPTGWVFVEGAGGPRSPLAHDGDTVDLAVALRAEIVVLVADAELGALNAVRLSAAAFPGFRLLVGLNRFDPRSDLHRRNLQWLESIGFTVSTDPVGCVRQIQVLTI